jgi:hypothetical protein
MLKKLILKYSCIAILLLVGNLTYSQDIIIGGVNKNRPLTWNDFKGAPDRGSSYDASTFWSITYNIKGISFRGDTAKIDRFSVILTLDENLSWSKPEKQTNILLKHEQGHFDLALICQLEIIDQLNSLVLLKTNFKEKIPAIFSSILEKYRSLELKYDAETDHSKNQAAQDSWNNFIAGKLK